MRLVKRTVNQDDTSAYHLFYADGLASPGSDLTFFDWPVGREQRGNNSVTRTGLRVSGGAEALDWWAGRLRDLGVELPLQRLGEGRHPHRPARLLRDCRDRGGTGLGRAKSITVGTEAGFAVIYNVHRNDIGLVIIVVAGVDAIIGQVNYRAAEVARKLSE